MPNPFLGEIRIFAGNFAPRGWEFCHGQLLSISQHTSLFALLGTTYGGNGTTSFGLPNLGGRAPLQAGQGRDLSDRPLGEAGGETAVTLTNDQMPDHTHSVMCNAGVGDNPAVGPAGNLWAIAGTSSKPADRVMLYANIPGTSPPMSSQAFASAGGGRAHNNMPPCLALNFIIATQGIFPPRG